jgi:hypothetical protein
MIVSVDELVLSFETTKIGMQELHSFFIKMFDNSEFLSAVAKYSDPYVYINPYTKEYGVCFSEDDNIFCPNIKVAEMYLVIKHISS